MKRRAPKTSLRAILVVTLLVFTGAAAGPAEQAPPRDAEQPCPPPQYPARRWPPEGSPKKLFHVEPTFPSRPTPTQFAPDFWIGEFDILTDGRVGAVRVLRHAKIDPPWPEWEEAISAAIREWRYGVPCAFGKAQKLTMTIVFNPVKRTFSGEESRSDKK